MIPTRTVPDSIRDRSASCLAHVALLLAASDGALSVALALCSFRADIESNLRLVAETKKARSLARADILIALSSLSGSAESDNAPARVRVLG